MSWNSGSPNDSTCGMWPLWIFNDFFSKFYSDHTGNAQQMYRQSRILCSLYVPPGFLSKIIPDILPYWNIYKKWHYVTGRPVLAAPSLPTTVTPQDSRSSLLGGRFLHSDREQEEHGWNVQLDCRADKWDWAVATAEDVRYNTVGSGVGLHDVVSGVVTSSAEERRKDVAW